MAERRKVRFRFSYDDPTGITCKECGQRIPSERRLEHEIAHELAWTAEEMDRADPAGKDGA